MNTIGVNRWVKFSISSLPEGRVIVYSYFDVVDFDTSTNINAEVAILPTPVFYIFRYLVNTICIYVERVLWTSKDEKLAVVVDVKSLANIYLNVGVLLGYALAINFTPTYIIDACNLNIEDW